MSVSKLDIATQNLLQWFQLFSLEDMVIGEIIGNSPTGQSALSAQFTAAILKELNPLDLSKNSLIKKLSSLLIETQVGSLSSYQLTQELDRIKAEFALIAPNADFPIVSIFDTGNFPDRTNSILEILGDSETSINENINRPTKDSPSLSIHLVNTRRVSLSNKNPNAISIFLNAIPTHEWSRSVPFINIKFQFQRPAFSPTGDVSTPSIVKFLEGSINVKEASNPFILGLSLQSGRVSNMDFLLQAGRSVDSEFQFSGDANKDIGEAGMELFLMPQTLVNPNSGDSDNVRSAPIIDKFRPLASLKSFNIDIVQGAGIMSYKTAKLSFVLHDISRTNEIADFLKAGLYNKTEMLIEYGWQHPDETSIFGQFINALKIKEKYQIMNNSFQLKTNGEADVDLDLFTKGAVDLYTSKISASGQIMEKQEAVERLQEHVAELSRHLYKSGKDSNLFKEIRGQQILDTASDTGSDLSLSKELQRELKKTLGSLSNTGSTNAKILKKELEKLYGNNGLNGVASDFKKSIVDAIRNKVEIIRKTDDPFIVDFKELIINNKNNRKLFLRKGEKSEQFVSLSKLLLLFVAQPLAETGKFDDIQLMFYPLNEHAGFGRVLNVGNFPIDISIFEKRYTKLASLRRTPNLSLREFINFISNEFLEDVASPAYGMRDFYYNKKDKSTGAVSSVIIPTLEKNQTKLAHELEIRMNAAGIPDGVFKLPHIDMYLEAVPGRATKEGEPSSLAENLTILRIHIFDTQASSFSSQSDFLSAQRDNSLKTLANEANKILRSDGEEKSDLAILVQKAVQDGLIEKVIEGTGEDNFYRVKGGTKKIKEFISKTMPTFIFRAANTAVIDAGLHTLQDQKLSTINMINSGDKGDLEPNGGATNGLPIRVFPAELNMRMLGCPIIEFTQGLFCDFGTNVSFDNVYAATRIQHVIEPGKFLSNVTFTPLDAYGQYQSAVSVVGSALKKLSDMIGSGLPSL